MITKAIWLAALVGGVTLGGAAAAQGAGDAIAPGGAPDNGSAEQTLSAEEISRSEATLLRQELDDLVAVKPESGGVLLGVRRSGQPSAALFGGRRGGIIAQLGIALGERHSGDDTDGDSTQRAPISFGIDFATRLPSDDAQTEDASPVQLQVGIGYWLVGKTAAQADGVSSFHRGTGTWHGGVLYHISSEHAGYLGYHSVRGVEIGYAVNY